VYKDKNIGVVVPAFNEELLLPETIEGMPEFVNKIIIIDDCSSDKTFKIATEMATKDERININKTNR